MDMGVGKISSLDFSGGWGIIASGVWVDGKTMIVSAQELNGLTEDEYNAGVRWMPGYPAGFHRVSYPKPDLMVGVVFNLRSWFRIEPYAVSLVKSGFRGTKIMFVQNIDRESELNLLNLGFTPIGFSMPMGINSCHLRYVPLIDWLKDKCNLFRYVIWTDVRDVIFQSDPSVWLENHLAPHKLIGCDEGFLIKNDTMSNDLWLEIVSGHDYDWVRKEAALCTGTIAGEPKIVLELFQKMYEASKSFPAFFGLDQGLLNYVFRLSPFNEVSRVVHADESFALQACGWATHPDAEKVCKPPRFDYEEGAAYPQDSENPYTIIHQYQWVGGFGDRIIKKYVPEHKACAVIEEEPLNVARFYDGSKESRDAIVRQIRGG